MEVTLNRSLDVQASWERYIYPAYRVRVCRLGNSLRQEDVLIVQSVGEDTEQRRYQAGVLIAVADRVASPTPQPVP
jgi:hypothetical protein